MKSINPTVGKSQKVDISKFWNTDISVMEDQFLKGRYVSTLPIHLDDRVPPQGSVLLDRVTQPKRKFIDVLRDFFR